MSVQTPKRLYITTLANGRIACAEYINAKRRNIIPPFRIDDKTAHARMRQNIDLFQKQNNNRAVVAVIRKDDFNAKHIADVLVVPLE